MRNNQRFCTRCLAYYCDHAVELDYEWTEEDNAALLAIDLPHDDEDNEAEPAGRDNA
jgi:hypothetical protein